MTFKNWLQTEQNKDFSYWKNLILGYLNLDQRNGLSQPLDTMNKNNLKAKLQSLGEFMKLSSQTQHRALGFIDESPGGTIGDLIRYLSGDFQTSNQV
jgi:hypothetical protein